MLTQVQELADYGCLYLLSARRMYPNLLEKSCTYRFKLQKQMSSKLLASS